MSRVFPASLAAALIVGKTEVVTTVITVPDGMKVGFALWLGFVATGQWTDTLFERKPLKPSLINTGYPWPVIW